MFTPEARSRVALSTNCKVPYTGVMGAFPQPWVARLIGLPPVWTRLFTRRSAVGAEPGSKGSLQAWARRLRETRCASITRGACWGKGKWKWAPLEGPRHRRPLRQCRCERRNRLTASLKEWPWSSPRSRAISSGRNSSERIDLSARQTHYVVPAVHTTWESADHSRSADPRAS